MDIFSFIRITPCFLDYKTSFSYQYANVIYTDVISNIPISMYRSITNSWWNNWTITALLSRKYLITCLHMPYTTYPNIPKGITRCTFFTT